MPSAPRNGSSRTTDVTLLMTPLTVAFTMPACASPRRHHLVGAGFGSCRGAGGIFRCRRLGSDVRHAKNMGKFS